MSYSHTVQKVRFGRSESLMEDAGNRLCSGKCQNVDFSDLFTVYLGYSLAYPHQTKTGTKLGIFSVNTIEQSLNNLLKIVFTSGDSIENLGNEVGQFKRVSFKE